VNNFASVRLYRQPNGSGSWRSFVFICVEGNGLLMYLNSNSQFKKVY